LDSSDQVLPDITTPAEFQNFGKNNPGFLQVSKHLLLQYNEEPGILSFPESGSLPVVFANDKYAIKFFPKVYEDAFGSEFAALTFLNKHNCACPKIFMHGKFDSWHYLIMEKLKGQSLKNLWPNLTPDERAKACFSVGKELKKIHSLPVSNAELGQTQSWELFLNNQLSGCFERHQKLGLQKDLLSQIPDFLKSVSLQSAGLSFLHTEVMQVHVCFEKHGNELELSGLLDFEPSMVGAYEYDFASVGVFLSSGDRAALKGFFDGYGIAKVNSSEFRRRILAYTLLHRYSNLKWYLEFMPQARTLEELADLWWAVD
jgi:hygromycin-B 7''-O-kinase